MKKVAVFAGSDLRNYGGGEKDIIGWTSRLKDKLDITVYSLLEEGHDNKHKVSKEFIEQSLNGVRLIWYKGRKLRLLKDVLPSLSEKFDMSEYDKVYSLCQGFILNAQLQRTSKKFLFGVHVQSTLDVHPIERTLVKEILHKLWRVYLLHYIRRADEIRIQNSDDMARVKSIGFKGKIWNVPPRMFSSNLGEPLPSDKFIVVWANRVEPEKRPEEIVKICNAMPDIEFHLIGKGSRMNVFDSITNKNVKVKGFLSDEELMNEYRQASAYISTSRGENFGMSAVEAMAYGVPTIVYDVMGLRDYNMFVVKDDKYVVAVTKMLVERFNLNRKGYMSWRNEIQHDTIAKFSDDVVLPQILEMMES